MEDFYLYQPREDRDLPADRVGAAAMSLLKEGKYPSWALFCYKELAAASDAPVPALRAYQGEDFILLAPREQDGYMKGHVDCTRKRFGVSKGRNFSGRGHDLS